MPKEITLRFTVKEIQEKLKKVFKAEHQELMSECIAGVLSEVPDGLEKVFKASMGIRLSSDYKVGDLISVRVAGLSSWRFDEEKMISENRIKHEHMTVKICSINTYASYPYTVTYNYYDKEDAELETASLKSTTSDVASHYITGLEEEFPLEL